MATEKEKVFAINLEIDIRLSRLWDMVGDDMGFTRDELARYMRAAYVYGYRDSLQSKGDEQWARDAGFDIGDE